MPRRMPGALGAGDVRKGYYEFQDEGLAKRPATEASVKPAGAAARREHAARASLGTVRGPGTSTVTALR